MGEAFGDLRVRCGVMHVQTGPGPFLANCNGAAGSHVTLRQIPRPGGAARGETRYLSLGELKVCDVLTLTLTLFLNPALTLT